MKHLLYFYICSLGFLLNYLDGDNLTNPTIPTQFRNIKTGPIVISKFFNGSDLCEFLLIMPNVRTWN